MPRSIVAAIAGCLSPNSVGVCGVLVFVEWPDIRIVEFIRNLCCESAVEFMQLAVTAEVPMYYVCSQLSLLHGTVSQTHGMWKPMSLKKIPMSLSLAPEWGLPLLVEWSM
jgi:hypothetical protein